MQGDFLKIKKPSEASESRFKAVLTRGHIIYQNAVCRPSAVFDPFSPESIADAVERYEKGGMSRSELLVHDQIETLIDVLEGRARL